MICRLWHRASLRCGKSRTRRCRSVQWQQCRQQWQLGRPLRQQQAAASRAMLGMSPRACSGPGKLHEVQLPDMPDVAAPRLHSILLNSLWLRSMPSVALDMDQQP